MWRVSNGDRFVEYQGSGSVWRADPRSDADMVAGVGQPVPLAPMSETYVPNGKADPLGIYLLARMVVPNPQEVSGVTPKVPAPREFDPDVAY